MKMGHSTARRSKSGSVAGLKDVARLAGVSPATVSRAVNTPALLDADTLRKVEDAVRKLRYVPNAQARGGVVHGLARSARRRAVVHRSVVRLVVQAIVEGLVHLVDALALLADRQLLRVA